MEFGARRSFSFYHKQQKQKVDVFGFHCAKAYHLLPFKSVGVGKRRKQEREALMVRMLVAMDMGDDFGVFAYGYVRKFWGVHCS